MTNILFENATIVTLDEKDRILENAELTIAGQDDSGSGQDAGGFRAR